MNIITLTLNPAYDIHCGCDSFEEKKENFVSVISRDAGGKGVNISRALISNGINNTALVVLGEQNSDDFELGLKKAKVNYIPIMLEGRIRENITIHPKASGETRISFAGFEANGNLLKKVENALSDTLKEGDVVTVTGSMPPGVSIEDAKELLKRLKSLGIKIVIDSRSFSLSDIIELSPWLIKPNQEEISKYLGREILTLDDAANSAKELFDKGVENAMISLGSKGAVVASCEGVFKAVPPSCKPVSTIGAGDSSIAGFIAAAKQGRSTEDCLKTAMAYGNAACLTEGTNPPNPQMIVEILPKVEIIK